MTSRRPVGALGGYAASAWGLYVGNAGSLFPTGLRPLTVSAGHSSVHIVAAASRAATSTAAVATTVATEATATSPAGATTAAWRHAITRRALSKHTGALDTSLSSFLRYQYRQYPFCRPLTTGPPGIASGTRPAAATTAPPPVAEGPSVDFEGVHDVRFDLSQIPGTENARDGYLTLVFTCCKCNKRSAKKFSKVAYTRGVVIVRCPGCSNLHLVADRLKWFGEEESDVETILAAKGEKVLRTLSASQVLDIEGLDCSSQTAAPSAPNPKT